MKKPEILAPAGNMEKLKVAVRYGADAVYLGGKAFGLRNLADNFTADELKEALDYCHGRGVKVYLTVNSFPHDTELPALQSFLEEIRNHPFDAYIAADPGVIDAIREISPERPIHLSTQANTTNWRSVRFWENYGIGRVNLAREVSQQEILEIRSKTKIELEAFVHGAMCISYSGRCLLSSIMTGRNANKGECTHPCRWKYSLVEETRPGQYYPVEEEGGRTFIFNSKDLCLLPYLPDLVNCGVDSLKIEGRMKGIHYLATVLRVYRCALDRYFADPTSYECLPEWLDELARISHRGYTTGFFLGPPRESDQEYHSAYIRTHDLVGVVEEISGQAITIGVRNRFSIGDILELVGPEMVQKSHQITDMAKLDQEGGLAKIETAHPNDRVVITLPFVVEKYDLLRLEKRNRPD